MIYLEPSARIASFDVDAQKCFTPLCPHELPVPEGHLIASALNRQAEKAVLRVGSKDAHPAMPEWLATEANPALSSIQALHMDTYWPAHAVVGSFGFELIEGLPAVMDYDFFIWKGIEPDVHPYGACFHDLLEKRSTGVIEFLCSRKVDTVLVGGLALDYCVKVTAMQLHQAGFQVIVNLEATRALSRDSGENAITVLTGAGIRVVDNLGMLAF